MSSSPWLFEQRLLDAREAAAQQADDEVVVDVGLGSVWAAAVVVLEQGDEAIGELGAHVARARRWRARCVVLAPTTSHAKPPRHERERELGVPLRDAVLAAFDPPGGGLEDVAAVFVVALVASGLTGGVESSRVEPRRDGVGGLLVIAGPWLLAEQLGDAVGDRRLVRRLARRVQGVAWFACLTRAGTPPGWAGCAEAG